MHYLIRSSLCTKEEFWWEMTPVEVARDIDELLEKKTNAKAFLAIAMPRMTLLVFVIKLFCSYRTFRIRNFMLVKTKSGHGYNSMPCRDKTWEVRYMIESWLDGILVHHFLICGNSWFINGIRNIIEFRFREFMDGDL